MKKRYLILLLTLVAGLSSQAQTLAQAKEWYEKGEYEKARPVFQKLVKSQPANGNYNLWYGVSCLKTGQAEEGLKYLQAAVKRRVPSGQLYLAQAYNELYRFEEAIENYESYITDLTKRKRPTEEAEQLLEKSKENLRLLKGVERVCVIDSFVVDKADFLQAYRISPESGKIAAAAAYFGQSAEGTGRTVYETELGNKIFYSIRQEDGTLSLEMSNKLQGRWAQGILLPGKINEGVNADYPSVLSDGITIYYAADGEKSIGGYDIFVSRYNVNTDTYLTPENVGMPFNSPANDYMFVIDEFNNLGWFASDRYQAQDKVCIYVFIPNTSKQVYDYESMDAGELIGLAKLQSIQATWTDSETVEEARTRLAAAGNTQEEDKQKRDFCFVINDAHTYYNIDEFRSPEARKLYQQYASMEKSLSERQARLEQMRAAYAQANANGKASREAAILDLEQRVWQLTIEVEEAAIKVRIAEISTFK